MAAAAQAADGEHRNSLAIATSNAHAQQATVSAVADGGHQAETGPTTSSKRQVSPGKQSEGSVVQDAVADGADTEHTAETAHGDLSESAVERTGPRTERVVQRAREVHQEVADRLRDPAGGLHRAGHDVIETTRQQPDPMVSGGREAVEVAEGARDTVLSRVHDMLHDSVGDVPHHVHKTIAHTRKRVDRTREHIHPKGQLFEGSPPAGPHPSPGVGLPPDLDPGHQPHSETSMVSGPGAQAGHLDVRADHGQCLGQRLADGRTGAQSAVRHPANHANYPACPVGLDTCTFTAASTSVQHGPDQRRTSGLAHVTRPSALGNPWAVDRAGHDAWMLPSSPAFAPGVSPD
jgi:hypothetical protein